MAKNVSIGRFIRDHGIKRSWLARKIGLSVEGLWHHTKGGAKELPPELKERAIQQLSTLAEKISNFVEIKNGR